ncbi:MAG: flagellar motor protein MotB, partial [Alphaproteobacteria bacterium]|nr:flagellar motor protein MotB [Alphaproteobacteria bacterium]
MRGRRRRATTGTEQGASGQLLALALFIMLLAFFIVLNAISTFDETRVRPAMDSIEKAFASKMVDQPEVNPSLAPAPEQARGEGDTLDKIEGLFTAHIPGQDVVMDKSRGEMHVRVPYDSLKKAVFSIGAQTPGETDLNPFLPTLLGLLSSRASGV